jgi:ABC-type transport system involved in multi-copper enzyme maturation permease subunit
VKVIVLILHTFRELIAKATLIVLAAISTLILVGVFAALSTTESPEGAQLLVFGTPTGPPVPAERLAEAASAMQAGLAGGLFVGVLLFGVFATAGTIPDALEKGTVDLYLSKPLARWQFLLGKYLGAVSVVFANILYFVGVMWLIVGLRVGVWNTGFLLSALTLGYVFACLFGFVAFLGVLSRNTAIVIIGSFLYLFILDGLLEGRAIGLYMISEGVVYRGIVDAAYYLFPQIPAMQQNAVRQIVEGTMTWEPFLQGLLSGGFFLGAGMALLHTRDF